LQLDGAEWAARELNSAVYKDFVFEKQVTAGSHELQLVFTNAGDERQLIIDHVHIQFIRAVNLEPDSSTVSQTLPTSVTLREYPNPFYVLTLLQMELPADGQTTLKVFNLQGREVVTIINEAKTAGQYTIAWDGKDAARIQVAAGTYFVVLRHQTAAGGLLQIQEEKLKLLYLK